MHDPTFRLVLLAGFLAMLIVGAYHRIKAASGETLDRRQEGVFMLATLRPAAFLLWIGIIVYMVNPAWMAWSSLPLPVTWRWIGAGISIVAVCLLAWTLASLGPNLTDTVVTRQVHTLVTRGPYRWVRHPFYDAAALLIVATALVTANWFVLLTGCAVLFLLVLRTSTEEAHLVARFGPAYRTYMTQTGRFLPRRVTRPRE